MGYLTGSVLARHMKEIKDEGHVYLVKLLFGFKEGCFKSLFSMIRTKQTYLSYNKLLYDSNVSKWTY